MAIDTALLSKLLVTYAPNIVKAMKTRVYDPHNLNNLDMLDELIGDNGYDPGIINENYKKYIENPKNRSPVSLNGFLEYTYPNLKSNNGLFKNYDSRFPSDMWRPINPSEFITDYKNDDDIMDDISSRDPNSAFVSAFDMLNNDLNIGLGIPMTPELSEGLADSELDNLLADIQNPSEALLKKYRNR